MRPVVHIGFHKTASTWFQKSVYPRVHNFAYVPRERVHRALVAPSAFVFAPARAREELGLAASATPILCEEALSGSLLGGGMMGFQSAALAQRVHALFPDARIVIFVRSQPEMISATYLQYLRNGGTHGPHRFLWPDAYADAEAQLARTQAQFSFEHFEYDRLVSHYGALFGASSVHVFAYEELQRDGAAFLERFAKRLGLALEPGISMEAKNVSYPLAVARAARVLNRFTAHRTGDKHHWLHVPYWYGARKRLLESAAKSGWFGTRADAERLLGAQTVRWIRQRFVDSNQRLALRTGLDLAAFGYPLEKPPAPVATPSGGLAQRWLSH